MSARPWQLLVVFGACLALVLFGVGWISVTAIELDHSEAAARRQALVEENVRLALWRMDSSVAPIITRESARPYFFYASFYGPDRAYGRMLSEIQEGESVVASPLLLERPEHTLLHFQIAPDGRITSPQVPEGRLRAMAADRDVPAAKLVEAERRLEQLRARLSRDQLSSALPRAPGKKLKEAEDQAAGQAQGYEQQQQQQQVNDLDSAPIQAARSSIEWGKRAKTVRQAATQNAYVDALNTKNAAPADLERRERSNDDSIEGGMFPVWVGDALILARRFQIDGREHLQGCWVDWQGLRESLASDVQDLFPGATLVPRGGDVAPNRALAALPVELSVPEGPPPGAEATSRPVKIILGVAWSGVLLAAVAVAVLLLGTIALSERRAAFVSAVTHELRTPLTTFRMYTEMLAEGMVADEDKKRTYLETLRVEAVRLSHLVENVLSYARIERGRAAGRIEAVPIPALVERIRSRLADRAAQAGMQLEVAPPPDGLVVHADPSAVEQILFNLVDNACKYAAAAADRRIHLSAETAGGRARIRVTDHGPGIPADVRRRLFSPFSKSAQQAAVSAPGVGLGLALSRRLARSMRGELALEEVPGSGASFVLTLPR